MAELPISVASLLVTFKGTVESFVSIDAITEVDIRSRFLALKYHVERLKLDIWADSFKVQSPAESPLRFLGAQTRTNVTTVLAEIQSVNELVKKSLKRKDVPDRHLSLAPAAYPLDLSFDMSSVRSALVQALARDRVPPHSIRKFGWTHTDKDKFAELVERLRALVTALNELTRGASNESINRALPVYVVANIKDSSTLSKLQQRETEAGPLLSQSAVLKQLQLYPICFAGARATEFPPDALGVSLNGKVEIDTRQLCEFSENRKMCQRAWIEWKTVKADLSSSDRLKLELRARDLVCLLRIPTSLEYRTPKYLGLTRMQTRFGLLARKTSIHLGFVFAFPSTTHDELKLPISLLDLLKPDKQNVSREIPLLNDRFKLASALALSMSLMHASRWLHKAFRSSRILFFHPTKGPLSITEPFISGFELSRPEEPAMFIETTTTKDNAVNLYYHPDSRHCFNRLRDYYSLGVLLFEIAFWQPFEQKIPRDRGKTLDQMTHWEIYKILIESILSLESIMGTIYRDVVALCLTGTFLPRDDADGADIGRAFYQKVVRELEKCVESMEDPE